MKFDVLDKYDKVIGEIDADGELEALAQVPTIARVMGAKTPLSIRERDLPEVREK